MKRFLLLFILVLFFLSSGSISYAQSRPVVKTKQILVTFKKQPKAIELLNLAKTKKRSKLKFGITGTKTLVYEVLDADINSALEELRLDPSIENATVDAKLDLLYIPNDPAIKSTPIPGKPQIQWNMYNLNLAGNSRSAWDVSRGTPPATVAILDSGVDSTHQELSGKITSLVDCTLNNCSTVSSMTADPQNLDASHGTHVAGIVGAATDNNFGMAGSGFNTQMMIIKIRNVQGDMLISYFVNGIRYAADHNVKIINMSLGSLSANLDQAIIAQINDALNYAWNKNVLLVAAAGNCGWGISHHSTSGDPCDVFDITGNFVRHAVNEKFYPAAGPNVISVGALDINNNLAPYSEHNEVQNAQIGNWVTLAAPGGMFSSSGEKEYGIASTWPGNQYFYNLGTSSAAPHVSGIAALILAVKPTLSNQQLKNLLEQTSNHNIIPGKTNFGMIDPLAALDATDIPSPTNIIVPSKTPTPTPTRTPTPIVPTNPASPTASVPAGGKMGDGNNDGRVDGIDYVIWLNHYGLNASGAVNGDYNLNGTVDGVDYVVWRNNFGS